MRRYIRARTPGATYFFTLTLQDRTSAVLVEYVAELRASVAKVMHAHPFRIDAMVILPDHLHALWTLPPGDACYPMRWRLIKRGFTLALKTAGVLGERATERRGRDERSLWQRRYWEHQVRDEEDYRRHVEYIHFNPVKHGLVRRAGDWPYSSFGRFVKAGAVGADWGVAADFEGDYGE
jgi:putative transposase